MSSMDKALTSSDTALDQFIDAYAQMEIAGVDDDGRTTGLYKALRNQPPDKLAAILTAAIRRLATAPVEP